MKNASSSHLSTLIELRETRSLPLLNPPRAPSQIRLSVQGHSHISPPGPNAARTHTIETPHNFAAHNAIVLKMPHAVDDSILPPDPTRAIFRVPRDKSTLQLTCMFPYSLLPRDPLNSGVMRLHRF
ncbi:hypothetical protein ETB97_000268 [Aspergillus alliaceus]|uniref:Uncharacterized protein n=1 Tax=Petromyces alliaceus TaxID=209559 RepID=A0A8H6E6M0_PETAA|nr:hypothetical protein ETB97_000268 [Aspergillus burnettii]